MLKLSELEGVIFDVDDTLLSNSPDETGAGLHEHSRVAACRELGERHGNSILINMTLAEGAQDFITSPVHTVHGAAWNSLVRAGILTGDVVDPAHPLVLEIVNLKEILHEDILRQRGREVPGAISFVGSLHTHGMAGKLAVASTASRRDIDIFFDMSSAHQYFGDRIVSRELFTHPKPHREAFDLAYATLKLPESARRRVAAFEDDPRGIESAYNAGLYVCAITTRFDRKTLAELPTPPDVIADSYAEYAEMLGLPTPTPLQFSPKQPQ